MVAGEHRLNVEREISATCERERRRVIAPSLGSRIGLDGRGH
jgi:hypothetical protein